EAGRLAQRGVVPAAEAAAHLPEKMRHFSGLTGVVDRVAYRSLLTSNAVEPLFNGEQAYPAMLGEIRSASESISLSTYIFDNDKWGRIFADALAEAVERGVQVRV